MESTGISVFTGVISIVGFFVGQLVLFGIMLWKFYSIIQKNIDEKFNDVKERFSEVKDDIKEVNHKIDLLSKKVEKLEEKVHSIDKEVHVFTVFLGPKFYKRIDEMRKEIGNEE